MPILNQNDIGSDCGRSSALYSASKALCCFVVLLFLVVDVLFFEELDTVYATLAEIDRHGASDFLGFELAQNGNQVFVAGSERPPSKQMPAFFVGINAGFVDVGAHLTWVIVLR